MGDLAFMIKHSRHRTLQVFIKEPVATVLPLQLADISYQIQHQAKFAISLMNYPAIHCTSAIPRLRWMP